LNARRVPPWITRAPKSGYLRSSLNGSLPRISRLKFS